MKKLFIFITLMVFLFSGCNNSFFKIDNTEVEKIIIWTHSSERELTANETANIIELYNTSTYDGKATGGGGTPDFGVRIILKNNDIITVNDFGGNFEVFMKNRAFYLENEVLYELLKKEVSSYD